MGDFNWRLLPLTIHAILESGEHVTGFCVAGPSQRKRDTQVTLRSNSKHNEE